MKTSEDKEMTPPRQLPTRMPPDMYDTLKGYAHFTGRSMNEIILTALSEYLSDKGRREHFDAMVGRARQDYRLVLDKLKEL